MDRDHDQWMDHSEGCATGCYANAGIYNPAALPWGEREDGIQVEFADLRNFFDEARYPQQRLFQGVKIGRWVPPITG